MKYVNSLKLQHFSLLVNTLDETSTKLLLGRLGGHNLCTRSDEIPRLQVCDLLLEATVYFLLDLPPVIGCNDDKRTIWDLLVATDL